MRVYVIGDPHFKVANAQDCDEMVIAILQDVREKDPNLIVCLGDVLDRFANIHVGPLVRATKFLSSLSEIAHLVVIIGNHDRANNNVFCTEQHPFISLKTWERTTVVDYPIVQDFFGHTFSFVPYVSVGRFKEALDLIPGWEHSKAIFCHQEFLGAKMGAVESTTGDLWEEDLPLVISGHIHDYSRLQSNLIYVGTPMQHAFGDREDKTVSIFTFQGGRPDLFQTKPRLEHPEQNMDWSEERINLNLRKKKIVRITAANVINYKPPENISIKLVITGTSSQLKALGKSDHVKNLQKGGVKIAYQQLSEVSDQPRAIQPSIGYLEALYMTIRETEHQRIWFEHLFGRPVSL